MTDGRLRRFSSGSQPSPFHTQSPFITSARARTTSSMAILGGAPMTIRCAIVTSGQSLRDDATRVWDVIQGTEADASYEWHPQILDKARLTGSLLLVALTAACGTLAFFSLLSTMKDTRTGACSFFLTVGDLSSSSVHVPLSPGHSTRPPLVRHEPTRPARASSSLCCSPPSPSSWSSSVGALRTTASRMTTFSPSTARPSSWSSSAGCCTLRLSL